MGALAMVVANNFLDAALRGEPFFSSNMPMHCRLMTENGNSVQEGTEVPPGAGYTPGPDAPTADFGKASAGLSQNTNQIKIVNMPACTVRGVELWDSPGASSLPGGQTPLGVRKWWGPLATEKQLNAGDTFTINVGALTALQS